MVESLYIRNRIALGLYICALIFIHIYIISIPLIADVLIGAVFIILSVDMMLSIMGIYSQSTSVKNAIGGHLWRVKYEPNTSYINGLCTLSLFDYVLFFPAAIFLWSLGFLFSSIAIIVSLVIVSILAVEIENVIQNNRGYITR